MSFRTRLLLIVATAAVAASAAGTLILLITTTRTYEKLDEERRLALVEQFRREFEWRGQEAARRVHTIAQMDSTLRMAIDLAQPDFDPSLYVGTAQQLAREQSLDFLDILASDGRIVSSAHWPARFGYLHPWASRLDSLAGRAVFPARQELPEAQTIAMLAVETVHAGESTVYLVGGQQLDDEFLSTLAHPADMRLFLFRNLERGRGARQLITGEGEATGGERLQRVIDQVLKTGRPYTTRMALSKNAADSQTVQGIPLEGRDKDLLGVLMVASSRHQITGLSRFIVSVGILAALGGVLLGVVTGWWTTRRVTEPVQRLVHSVRKVTRGNWNTRVYVESQDEIGDLARAFNQMTEKLEDQRERLVQAERVAAWRELARRLAHELKNPLFPLQITVENLQRAKSCCPEEFDEVFEEGTKAMLAELRNLKTITARFSEFAKMPQPELREIDLNQVVKTSVQLFEPQFQARRLVSKNEPEAGKPGADGLPITCQMDLDPRVPSIHADPEQLTRVLQNLVLNAIDAMPRGGSLLIRTRDDANGVCLEVSDSGTGLTPEERERVFTPYYTTKQHGTGLGLAIVQSIVSDHAGRVSVESEPGQGTTFKIWLKK